MIKKSNSLSDKGQSLVRKPRCRIMGLGLELGFRDSFRVWARVRVRV